MADATNTIPEDARKALESMIWNEVDPTDKPDRIVNILNIAIRYEDGGKNWEFIECAISADDNDLLVIQLTVDGEPCTYPISIDDVLDIAAGS